MWSCLKRLPGLAVLMLPSLAAAADEARMMTICNTYAAHHLRLSERQIRSLDYQGQRSDRTHAVNGTAANGQTFQCTFNAAGNRVVAWAHSAPKGCPVDVSEADRYRYPDCR